jgi:metallo-beta-lactamase family protein
MKLSFHGGVEGITGSCHLLVTGGLNILIDCGLFQGDAETEGKNSGEFGFDPSSIDFLLLTHGHLDHCGRIPLLVKKGFQGTILCTSATYDIAQIVMLDSARINEEDTVLWTRIRKRKGLPPPEALYTTLDVLDSLRHFKKFVDYGKPVTLNDRVSVTFTDAGHIIGASFLQIQAEGRSIVFSGDLGNRDKPIIRDPDYPDSADICICEGTYSDRNHKDIKTSVVELQEDVTETFSRGGNVLIPSFAIERAQDILYYLSELYYEEKLPSCKVFLDSPMAINVTDIIRKHPECYDNETRSIFLKNHDPFSFPNLHFSRSQDESRKINDIDGRAVIIAGSGMCTGGRIKHHLKHNIWRSESSIIFLGYQANGTLGRSIVDRDPEVKIFGQYFPVRSKIHTIGGFSAHADRSILLDWIERCRRPERLFLVHGEENALSSFEKEVRSRNLAGQVHFPEMHQTFTL